MCPRAGLDVLEEKPFAPARNRKQTIKKEPRFKHTPKPCFTPLTYLHDFLIYALSFSM
jgi:hypothetical protein